MTLCPNTPRIRAGLVVGHYQPWRTVTYCRSPEPRHFLKSGGQKTLEKRLLQSAFRCFHKIRKAGSPKWGLQPLPTQELLEFGFRASFFELFLGSFCIGLWNVFLDVLWSAVHQVFGFLEAQTSEFTHGLDDLHLVGAYFKQHNVEFSLFLSCCSACASTAGSGRGHGGCAHAKFLFDGFHQVVEFEDRHAIQRGQKCVFIECHFDFLKVSINSWGQRSRCAPRTVPQGSIVYAAAGSAAGSAACATSSAPPFFATSAASTTAVRDMGDISKPHNMANNTSLDGMLANCFTPFTSSGLPSNTPPRITSLSLVFANSATTFAAATASTEKP